MSTRSTISHKNVTLPAGQQVELDLAGEFIAFTKAGDTQFRLHDSHTFVPALNGATFRLKAGERFRRVWLSSAAGTTAKFYYGQGIFRLA